MKEAERFLTLMEARMREIYGYENPCAAGLGRITADGGLKLDSFPVPLPKGQYLVCRTVKQGIKTDKDTVAPPLSPGDRVLVSVAGTDYVVVDVVESS